MVWNVVQLGGRVVACTPLTLDLGAYGTICATQDAPPELLHQEVLVHGALEISGSGVARVRVRTWRCRSGTTVAAPAAAVRFLVPPF